MSSGSIARRWARALFQLADERKNSETVARDMAALAGAFEVSDEIESMMGNSKIPVEVKRGILDALLQRLSTSEETSKFMRLLLAKHRISFFVSIAREFSVMADSQAGVVRVSVTSAHPLDSSATDQVKQRLAVATRKNVQLTTSVDETLIGGIVTTVGDTMYDGSVRTQLERVKRMMLSSQ